MLHVPPKPWFHLGMCGRCVKLFNVILLVVSAFHPALLFSYSWSGQNGRKCSSCWNYDMQVYAALTTTLNKPVAFPVNALHARVLGICEWSELCWLGQALGTATLLAWQSFLNVGTEDRALWVDWYRRGMGHTEGLNQFCYFGNSGFNCRNVLSLVQTNFSVGRTWCIR